MYHLIVHTTANDVHTNQTLTFDTWSAMMEVLATFAESTLYYTALNPDSYVKQSITMKIETISKLEDLY